MTRCALALAALLLGALPGCYYGAIQPRTAALAPPGELAGSLDLPVFSYASAKVVDSEGRRGHSDSGLRGQPIVPILAPFVPVANASLNGRLGLTPGLEMGATLGLQQLGVELRTGITQGALSLAFSFGSLYRPFDDATAVLLRSGIDISFATKRITPLINVMISNGPETHLLDEERFDACDEDDFVSCSATLTRRETRLSVAAGVAFRPDPSNDTSVVLAVVPHYTIWADDELSQRCTACSDGSAVDVASFDERWGAYVTLGVDFGD